MAPEEPDTRHTTEYDPRRNGQRPGVPYAVAIPILFGLISIIGAITTWALAGLHERQAILEIARDEWKRDINADKSGTLVTLTELARRMAVLEQQQSDTNRQVNVNTGRLTALEVRVDHAGR